jgi:hypothetical protein
VENRTESLDGEQWTPELQAAADAGAERRPDWEVGAVENRSWTQPRRSRSPESGRGAVEKWSGSVEHRTRTGSRAVASRRRPDREQSSGSRSDEPDAGLRSDEPTTSE